MVRTTAAVPPRALFRPAVTPLVPPLRRRLALPLLPLSGRDVVVAHGHHQDRPWDELPPNQDPRSVVAATHVPAAVGEDPVLTAVEEDVRRRRRRLLDRR